MPRLQLNAVKIVVHCLEGDFGAFVPLTQGLNIIRARNSTGKSSILNSILYGLGIEQLLGGTNGSTMKPVLRDVLKYQGKTLKVLESKVQLEVSNQRGESVAITRWVKADTIDPRLLRVQFGPVLTKGGTYESKDFYVHMQGAAVDGSGFHKFLAEFIGWSLPQVPTFDGTDRKLYIQSLFPLFFIEQLKGWSSFYSPLPSNFGIRDISKRAIEFILGLDVLENARKRDELRVRKMILTENWKTVLSLMEKAAAQVNGFLSIRPLAPDLSSEINLLVYDKDQRPVEIDEQIMMLKELASKPPVDVKRIAQVVGDQENQLSELEWEVSSLQNAANSLRVELHLESGNSDALRTDLENLRLDLSKNKEAKKLYSLGSEMQLSVADGICPTCRQHIRDSLLPQDVNMEPMGIDENIKYINEQINAIEFALAQSHEMMDRKKSKLNSLEELLRRHRRRVRELKKELNEDPRMPTRQDIEQYIETKSLLSSLEEAKLNMDSLTTKLDEIRIEWKQYLTDKGNATDDYFTELDKKKLKTAEKLFREFATKFGYHSGDTTDISISEDKYTPTVKGYDIKFDSSASDHVRLIWAYACTILGVSNEFGGNHPRLLVLDEPGQQQMAPDSQKELFELLVGIQGQHLVASSLSEIEITELTSGIDVNIINLGNDYVIKPLQ